MKTMTTLRHFISICLLIFCVLSASLGAAPSASAHPEDEFCTPGEDALDPALCRALSQMDKAAPSGPYSDIYIVTEDLDRSIWETLALYVKIGFQHIIPKGLDHILFVLALVVSTRKIGSLLWQISAFTIAHTATLGLTAAGVIAPSSDWVEPLIALTIAWAALENLFWKEPPRWRTALIFAFGLLHGMGFAGAFADLGLPDGIFWPALIGFNIGVEFGQLVVIGIALALITLIIGLVRKDRRPEKYRGLIVWPVSLCIAAIGVWWAVERTFL